MKYREIADGIFVDRPNRFIAHVGVNGAVETVHVKNTGRCRELLLPGTAVRLEVSDNPKRKTKYDLVVVHKQGLGWVNMDSQAPIFPGCTHRAGCEAPARAGTGTVGRVSVRSGFCDSDGRHHRGAAKCQDAVRVWYGTGRGQSCRCVGAVFALPCRAG